MSDTCPHCLADLRDAEILREHLEAGYYGPWTPEDGPRFYSRKIGVEVPGVYDGVLYWQCPDCGDRWHRWPDGHRLRAKAAPFVNAVPAMADDIEGGGE